MSIELKQSYKSVLGDEFGEIYYLLKGHWIELSVLWRKYENLFGSGPERVDLLNKCGSEFFYYVEWSFFESAILAVCRLTDKLRTGTKENLTINMLPHFMDSQSKSDELLRRLDIVEKETEFQRDWRNRRYGHNDLLLQTGIAKALKDATRNKMNAALESIYQVFQFVESEYFKTHLANEVLSDLNNEFVMLEALYDGRRQKEVELERLSKGIMEKLEKKPEWLYNK